MSRSSTCFAEMRRGRLTSARGSLRPARRRTVAGLIAALGLLAPALWGLGLSPSRAYGQDAAPMPRPAGAPEPSAAPGAAAALAAGVGAGRAERLDHAADRMAGAVAEAPAAERGVGEVYEDGVGLLSYSIKVIALLGGLCALGFLTVKVVGAKLGPLAGSAGDAIRVRAMKRLDAKTTLYLVDVAGKTALVGVSDREVRALSRLDLADASAGDEEGGAPGGAEMVGGRPSDRSDGGGSRFEALLGRKALRRGRTKGSSK